MPSAALLHLRPTVPLADPPPPTLPMSATTPSQLSLLTTELLDPALPLAGAPQTLHTVTDLAVNSTTFLLCFGRWLTRPLPGQAIGAGNWAFGGMHRSQDSGATSPTARTAFGFTVAQWRPSSGAVVARAVDSPTGGLTLATQNLSSDIPIVVTLAGSALTLTAGDCLCLELWETITTGTGTAGQIKSSLCYNGLAQYAGVTTLPAAVGYAVGTITDADAWLHAPQAITFS